MKYLDIKYRVFNINCRPNASSLRLYSDRHRAEIDTSRSISIASRGWPETGFLRAFFVTVVETQKNPVS